MALTRTAHLYKHCHWKKKVEPKWFHSGAIFMSTGWPPFRGRPLILWGGAWCKTKKKVCHQLRGHCTLYTPMVKVPTPLDNGTCKLLLNLHMGKTIKHAGYSRRRRCPRLQWMGERGKHELYHNNTATLLHTGYKPLRDNTFITEQWISAAKRSFRSPALDYKLITGDYLAGTITRAFFKGQYVAPRQYSCTYNLFAMHSQYSAHRK